MAKRATREDFAKLRSALRREMVGGVSFDDAVAKVHAEDPEIYKRVAASKPSTK